MGQDYVPVIYDKLNKSVILPSSKDGKRGIWWSGVCLQPINDSKESLILSIATEDLLENDDLSDNRLKKLASTIDEEANPVLVLARFK